MALSSHNGGRGRGRPNTLWDPFQTESPWNMFDLVHFSPTGPLGQSARAIAGNKVDWLETQDAHVFKAELPGVKKEDIKVELEDDRVLQISGELSHEFEDKEGDRWHTVERSYGKFLRRFKLPDNAHIESVSAKVENGVLTVTIPKIQTNAPATRTIEVA